MRDLFFYKVANVGDVRCISEVLRITTNMKEINEVSTSMKPKHCGVAVDVKNAYGPFCATEFVQELSKIGAFHKDVSRIELGSEVSFRDLYENGVRCLEGDLKQHESIVDEEAERLADH